MSDIDRPNRYPLPPVMTVATLGLCYALHVFLPLGWEPEEVTTFARYTGVLLIFIAFGMDIWAALTFRRYRANIMPHRAATAVISDGPFAYSRNPIYLANVLMVAGFGFALGSRWFFIGALVLFVLLQELAIKREERHMDAKFGATWRDYAKAVRRWI
ncbi:MAG: isoprenylcysteine carboxylmethyltransferase family protein [Pseudomonadota bacterium]